VIKLTKGDVQVHEATLELDQPDVKVWHLNVDGHPDVDMSTTRTIELTYPVEDADTPDGIPTVLTLDLPPDDQSYEWYTAVDASPFSCRVVAYRLPAWE
jgi:hypothetical protein